MPALLLTPISPQVRGNGLARRAAMWVEALEAGGRAPLVVVVPVAGPAGDAGGEHVVLPSRRERDDVPALARGVDRRLGRQAALGLAEAAGIAEVDVVVCLRSYLGRAALGLRDVLGGALVLDLDDDDVAFFAQSGAPDEADRFARLVDALRPEADLVVCAGGVADATVVPNSVRPAAPRTVRVRPPVVAMVANMGYAPNAAGARWFVDEVLPLVAAAVPDVALRIAGPGSELLAPHGTGFVDDLGAFYDAASVVVAPVLVGSGTRTKIIEAWAHGVPVVSTTIGADGLGGVDGEHVLLADDPHTFASAVVALLTDAERASRLGDAGRALASRDHDRAAVITDVRARLASARASLALAPAPRLHVVETDEGLVVLDIPSGDVHELDAGAAAVFSVIDDVTDADAVAGVLADVLAMAEPPVALVTKSVQHLLAAGLVVRTRRPVRR